MTDRLDAFERTFARLRAKYAVQLPATVAELEVAWHRIVAGDAPAAALADIVQIVHNISGNAKTFGFGDAGDVARDIELCLEAARSAGRAPDEAERQRVDSLLAALRRAI